MSAKIQSEVLQLRQKITDLKSRLVELDDGRIPRELAEIQVDQLIAESAKRGRLSVNYIADGQRMPYTDGRSTFDLLCWLNPDQVRARFLAELDGIYADGKAGIEPAERAGLEQKCREDLFKLEVAEERAILKAEEGGTNIKRRGDADPAAVLEA